MQKSSQHPEQDAGPNFPLLGVVALVVFGLMAFLMYYGFIHTPDNPINQMG